MKTELSNQNKMSKEVEQLKQALELAKSNLQVAEKALNDIVKWDDDLEDEWGDPGYRAKAALAEQVLDLFAVSGNCEWCGTTKENPNGLCRECARFPSPSNYR